MRELVSIEALLDPVTEERVRAEWDALAEAGLPSLASHTAPSNRPHITLLVRPALEPFDARDLVTRLPGPVTLGAPILFGSGERRVLVRGVVPSPELLMLHADLHALVPAGEDAAHTRPRQWTPHVTLARRLRLEDLPRALPLIGEAVTGQLVGLRRWDAASATVTALG